MKEFKHLSYASSLCGKCTEVCPVRIDLHKLLLFNRRDSAEQSLNPRTERWVFYFWKRAMLSRRLMNQGNAKMKNFVLRNFFRKNWGDRRALPEVATRSFNDEWLQRRGRQGA
jgi:L-lactate dehydrogenase complex protein LldF